MLTTIGLTSLNSSFVDVALLYSLEDSDFTSNLFKIVLMASSLTFFPSK